MTRRTGWKAIVTISRAVLCLAASLAAAADAQSTQKPAQKSDKANALREAVLARFDLNHNGRLDSREKAAALRQLTSRDDSDQELNDLRAQILARFDKNGNGKLERSEVRTALASVNAKSQSEACTHPSAATAAAAALTDRGRVAAAIKSDPSAAVAFTAQQLTATGIDAATAQQLAFQQFDLNGDGVLDQSELAFAQALLLRQLAQAAAATSLTTGSLVGSTPFVTSTTTGTGTSGTGTSGTGNMSGGCTSGSSGTGSSGTGTTNSVAQAANNRAFGNFNPAAAGPRSFGAGRR